MKTNFLKTIIIFLIAGFTQSCDKNFDTNLKNGSNTKTIGINYAAIQPINLFNIAPIAGQNLLEIDLGDLFYSGEQGLDKDLPITVTLNNTLISNYNTANGTNFLTFGANALILPLNYVIKKGEKSVKMKAKISLSDISLANSYAIGLSLGSFDQASGVVINPLYREALYGIIVKNKYDGIYKITGTFQDVTNATFTDKYPLEYQLITTGASTVDVKMLINGAIVPGYLFNANGAGSFFGNWGISLNFDPATDGITGIRNFYGVTTNAANAVGNPSAGSGAPLFAASNTRRAELDITGANKYFTNHNIELKYFMYQPSIVATGPTGLRCKFNELMTYIGPR